MSSGAWVPRAKGSGLPARGETRTHPPFEDENLVALKSGASSPRMLLPLVEQYRTWVLEVAPWTARPAFAVTRERWAWAEAEVALRRAWAHEHGLVDAEGEDHPGTISRNRAEERADRLAAKLGLDPQALAKLLATVSSISSTLTEDGLEALIAEGRRIALAREGDGGSDHEA